jgi:hypothetical protein
VNVIVEQRLVFRFGPSWQVEKYDEHPIHQKGIGCLQGNVFCEYCSGKIVCQICDRGPRRGTKAVDILGSQDGQLYFIEIKDFREYRIQNKSRLHDGDLAVEVALKVRDTLAGLVGTIHTHGSPIWHTWAGSVFKTRPKVLLWLEEDIDPDAVRKRGHAAPSLVDTLGNKLRWLNPHVMVKNQRLSRPVPDLEVGNLADGIFKLRELMKNELDRKPPGSISRDDFCRVMRVAPLVAGEKLVKLCDKGFLARVRGKDDRYTPGLAWDQFHEEPT